jgi:hypothetical protein
VSGIQELKEEFEAKGVKIGNSRVDERDGRKQQAFLSSLQMDSATTFIKR